MDNVKTIHEIYAAFGRGDIPAILGRLAEGSSGSTERRRTAFRGFSRGAAGRRSPRSLRAWVRSTSANSLPRSSSKVRESLWR